MARRYTFSGPLHKVAYHLLFELGVWTIARLLSRRGAAS